MKIGGTSSPSRLLASTISSENRTMTIASSTMKPSTAWYQSLHIPIAHASITTEKTMMPPGDGCFPAIFAPAAHRTMLLTDARPVRITPARIGHGRSPSPSGTSAARAAALRSSERARYAATAGCSGLARGRSRLRLRLRCANRRLQLEAGSQHPCRPLGVSGLSDRAHDGDSASARRHDGGKRARIDAADREERQARVLPRVGDQLEADGGSARLGRCRVHGPDADVVDGQAGRRVDLSLAVSREADQALGAEQCPGSLGRGVVLPEMDPVRAHGLDEVGPVVEDQRHAVAFAEARVAAARRDDLLVLGGLDPQLHDLDAALQCGVQVLIAEDARHQVQLGGSESAPWI